MKSEISKSAEDFAFDCESKNGKIYLKWKLKQFKTAKYIIMNRATSNLAAKRIVSQKKANPLINAKKNEKINEIPHNYGNETIGESIKQNFEKKIHFLVFEGKQTNKFIQNCLY